MLPAVMCHWLGMPQDLQHAQQSPGSHPLQACSWPLQQAATGEQHSCHRMAAVAFSEAAGPITAHTSLTGDFERDRGYEPPPRGLERRPPPLAPRLAPRGGGGLDVTHRYLPGGAPPRSRPSASRSACLQNSCWATIKADMKPHAALPCTKNPKTTAAFHQDLPSKAAASGRPLPPHQPASGELIFLTAAELL